MSQSTSLNRTGDSFGNFEEIERAVMETPRGRWFLEEFAKRQRAQDMSGILRAMERLERALDLKKVTAEPAVSDRISKAIDTIDEARAPLPAPHAEGMEARQLRYFKNDEEIFEPAPPTRPVAVASPAPVEAPSRGARLTIRHKSDSEHEASPAPLPMPVTEAEDQPKRRIVIIRHKAGEPIDVPLPQELAASA